MTAQQVTKGSGYNTNLSYNGLTNQIATPGYGYDANGNLMRAPSQRDNRSEVGAIIYSEVSLIAYSEAGRSRQETETK